MNAVLDEHSESGVLQFALLLNPMDIAFEGGRILKILDIKCDFVEGFCGSWILNFYPQGPWITIFAVGSCGYWIFPLWFATGSCRYWIFNSRHRRGIFESSVLKLDCAVRPCSCLLAAAHVYSKRAYGQFIEHRPGCLISDKSSGSRSPKEWQIKWLRMKPRTMAT